MVVKNRDSDVRVHLHEYLRREVVKDKDAVVIDELTLQRKDGRIDVAVVDSRLRGYEIKSEADKLTRLTRQTKIYGKVFDQLSVVVDDRHLQHVVKEVPEFWGLYLWLPETGIGVVREPSQNPEVHKLSLAQLLWRDTALSLLKEHNAHKGMASKPKWRLWPCVAETCAHEAIHSAVLSQFKSHRRLTHTG
jgi:hypothetical protein